MRPLPAWAFVTHQILSPTDRQIIAACSEVGCLAYRHGWDKPVDEATELGQAQARLIRSGRTGRTFREMPAVGGLTVFRFAPYQRCFAEHRTRAEVFLVRGGNEHVSTGLIRRHTRPIDFVDDLRTTLDRRQTDVQRRRG